MIGECFLPPSFNQSAVVVRKDGLSDLRGPSYVCITPPRISDLAAFTTPVKVNDLDARLPINKQYFPIPVYVYH